MLERIKDFLVTAPILNGLVYCIYLFYNKKNNFKNSDKIIALNKLEYSPLFGDGMVSSKKVCHIIGSGYSLNVSYKYLTADDFVIGFNFAGMIGLDFDVYFIELASDIDKKLEDISNCQYRVVKESISEKTRVIFKNIYSEAIPQSSYISKYKELNAVFVKDYQIPTLSPKLLKKSVATLLSEEDKFLLPQLKSTMYTAISYAYRLGFKEIVVHGLDFGGPYFFDTEDFIGSLKNRPSYVSLAKIKTGENHLTNTGKVSSIDILNEINYQLKLRGVNLYSSTKKSRSSDYLPVYYTEQLKDVVFDSNFTRGLI